MLPVLSGLEEDVAGAGRQMGFRTGMCRQDWSTESALHQEERWVLGARGREEEARPGQGPLSPLQEGVCRQGGSAGRGRDASLLLNLLFFQNQMSKRDFPSGPVVKASPSSAGGAGLIPGWGARIPHVSWPKDQNIKQKQYGNKFSEDFKNGPH